MLPWVAITPWAMSYRAKLLAKEIELLGVTNTDDAACGGGGSGRGVVVGGTNYTMEEGEKIHVKIPVLTNNLSIMTIMMIIILLLNHYHLDNSKK